MPITGEGPLFFLKCTAKTGMPDNTVGAIKLERLLREGRRLSYLNERDKPPVVIQNGSIRVRNPNYEAIFLSVPADTLATAGTTISLPVRVSALYSQDLPTVFNFVVSLPPDLLESVDVVGDLLPTAAVVVSPDRSTVTVSGATSNPINGSGTLFRLACLVKSGAPEDAVGAFQIQPYAQLPYVVKGGLAMLCTVQNGVVRVRNPNLTPAAIRIPSDTAAITGTRISLGVIASGLLSADGLTSLKFSVSLPPELLSEFTVRPGLFPAGAITVSGQSANVLIVSGTVANPETGVDTLFTIDGLVRQSIPDGTMYAVAIEHLIESGNPVPIVLKGGQSPECTVENSVIKVRSSSSVVSDNARTPPRAELLAYPNPFNSAVTFRLVGYEQGGAAHATLYTGLGTVVRSWTVAGPEWVWDGRDQQGAEAASGVYFLVVNSHTENYHKRVTLLR